MMAQVRNRLEVATCEQLLLLAVFGDDGLRERVDRELDLRAQRDRRATLAQIGFSDTDGDRHDDPRPPAPARALAG